MMERVIDKKVDAVLTSDWHLREKDKNPVCRTDDTYSTQWCKVDFISKLQQKYSCPVLHAGDLFDHWKPSPELLSDATIHIPDMFFTIYGNHDLPQHNFELSNKSGTYNLTVNHKVSIMACMGGWGLTPDHWKGYQINMINKRPFFMWHIMTYQGVKPFPGCTDPSAAKLLRQYPQYDLIITGDNHKAFVEEYKGRLLVNPGSILRMDADQIDFRPRVYLYHAKDNTVTLVFIPINKDAVSREHLDVVTARNGRIDAFIESLNDEFEASVSFEENIEQFRQKSKITDDVMNIIYKALE